MTEQRTESSAAETDTTIAAADPELAEAVQASSLTFADFNVRPEIVEALAAKGITTPFPIQAETLPIALGGYDIIGQAKTGTGKTLGFGIPAIQRVTSPDDAGYDDLPAPGAPQALIVAPTRELAVQVASDIKVASARRGIRVATIYGGRAYEPQIEELDRGVEIVVGTPGRLIDLHRQRHLKLKNVNIVVLDEADEMLDLGFLPDVETLLSAVPEIGRQTMLFSATMPGPVVAMARRYMTKPTHISAADPLDEGITKKDIRQLVYRAHHLDKDEVIARLLQAEGRGRTIVFTRTKRQADRLSAELQSRGFAAGAIHGDLGQGAREQALRAFRNEKIDVLVATDVAARGIDVTDITHVINLTAPEDEKAYLHRVGRTGRAGKTGIAVTFVDWEDMPKWKLIDKALGLGIPEPIETYSSSPHLYEDLDIPKGTKGRLPRHKRSKAGLDAEELEDLGGPEKRRSSGGRGDRDGGRGSRAKGGRGGRDSENGGRGERESGQGSRSAAPRSRNRRRTRSGEDSASASQQQGQSAPAEASSASSDSPTQPRRRRRRRGGSGSGGENASSES
ncbi:MULTISPECIES: DEAD/DEAH box helicase [Nesterenkonia]|uniref:RNA helicase n=2 Tax=Nesterenkonia TaxID=57494 RepID=A0A839FWR9_9MICC|nr:MULTISPECIES: DEAD/DEAH box helicase [Nesterenkonia]MBA8921514.1 superfamily II DNA/RNA helicase [Nesterenkonia jeotgali]NYJ16954.1 superfamily II DNA/RNA helicase [Nesterenkonia sandarakina]